MLRLLRIRRPGRTIGVAAAASLALWLPLPPTASAGTAPCQHPGDFALVPGQGPSCMVGDLWIVLLDTGETVLTHGADPPRLHSALGAAARPVPCAADGAPAHELVYARPFDRTRRYRQVVPLLREAAAQANGQLNTDAGRGGATADFPFRCRAGAPLVHDVTLLTASSDDSFASIVSGLKAAGLDDARSKYWVFYDDTVAGGARGQATLKRDDRADSANANNAGPSWGIAYGEIDAGVLMHESAHTMGAVQLSAPHSSGAWHCNDGWDVMCYADGGPSSAFGTGRCPALRFDCGLDDYFHPAPAAGSYLAAHWNLGSPHNRFLRVAQLPPPAGSPPPAAAPGATPAADGVAPRPRVRAALRTTRARLLRVGLPVSVACDERCTIHMELRTRGRRPVVLASVRRVAPAANVRRGAWLRPRPAARRHVRSSRTLALRIRVTDAAGNSRLAGRLIRLR